MSEQLFKSDVKIRLYENKDFLQFVECIKGFYGDGYPYREYLDANYLKRLTDSGDLILTVAVLPDGKIVGTVGARYMHGAFEGSVLLLLRNIKEDYRDFGISSYQLNDLLNRVAASFPDATSLYADVMTHDIISQNSLIHRGYTLTALRLMVYKNKIIVPHLKYSEHTKMTQAVYCKCLSGDGNVTLYVPDEHKEEIRNIYLQFHKTVYFEKSYDISQKESAIEFHFNEIHAHAEIIVMTVGKDIENAIMGALKPYTGYKELTETVYLNMSERGSIYAYEILKQNGFYYSGIKPLSKAGEYMILSKTDGCPDNYSDICLPENGTVFKNYVKMQHEYAR